MNATESPTVFWDTTNNLKNGNLAHCAEGKKVEFSLPFREVGNRANSKTFVACAVVSMVTVTMEREERAKGVEYSTGIYRKTTRSKNDSPIKRLMLMIS